MPSQSMQQVIREVKEHIAKRNPVLRKDPDALHEETLKAIAKYRKWELRIARRHEEYDGE